MVQYFFRKIEYSALFIPLVHKPPIFQNPNLMDELLDFGILSILKKFKKNQNKRSINSADNTIYLFNKILLFNNLPIGCEKKMSTEINILSIKLRFVLILINFN